MAGEESKTIIDHAAIWSPIVIALGALAISWIAYKKTEDTIKYNFINNLRDKVKTAKHAILNLEDISYSQDQKMSIIETIQDLLLYQGYREEKKKFLTEYLQVELSKLQESIEDNVGSILIQDSVVSYKSRCKAALNGFLQQL